MADQKVFGPHDYLDLTGNNLGPDIKEVDSGIDCPLCFSGLVFIDTGGPNIELGCQRGGHFSAGFTRFQYEDRIASLAREKERQEKQSRTYRVVMEFPQAPDYKECHVFELARIIKINETVEDFKERVVVELKKECRPHWCQHGIEPIFLKFYQS